MAPADNSLRASIPSLAAIEHRRRELLAWQAAHRAPSPASSDDPAAAEDPYLEEVNRLAEQLESLQALENLQEAEAPESPGEPYPAEYLIPSSTAPEPPALAEPALYGLAGLFIRSLAAHTEADPAAILLQFLAAFGNILGPGPHCTVGATRHGLNLFVVLVGESSKARKASSTATPSPGADAPPPFGPPPEAQKMPAGGLNAHNALNAHPPQRKTGHFTRPKASTRMGPTNFAWFVTAQTALAGAYP